MSKKIDDKMVGDIRELCICCAKSVAVISERYHEDPRLVSKLFIEVYNLINSKLEES